MSARWRGTIVYAGSLALIGAAAFARYGIGTSTPGVTEGPGVAPVAGATAAVSPALSSPPPSSDPSAAASPAAPAPSAPPVPSTEATTAAPAPEATTAAPAPEPPPAQDVVITGSAAQTRYGAVQVAVTFSGGRIVDVITVQAPDGTPESRRHSAEALPVLRQEALDAQSAQIDTYSGATYTSEGYRTSLQSAIDQQG